jgi:RluA family pseudouridine synthase
MDDRRRTRNLSMPTERIELEVRASDFQRRGEELALRLDSFLQIHLHWRSRTSIQALIKDGFVQVASAAPELAHRCGAHAAAAVERRPGRALRHGARVVVTIPEELRLPRTGPHGGALAVLYEDDEIVAIDKPPFLSVHPSGRHLTDTLIQRVHAYYGGDADLSLPIRLCHRLDRETSGIVLCAKGDAVHRALATQFELRQVEKEYLAIVHGVPATERGAIELPLGPARDSAVRLKIAVTLGGWPSCTQWRLVERRRAHALLACRPVTGRQHQIRVHLAAIGHPIVGDKLYGPDETLFLRDARGELSQSDLAFLELPRHALHSHELQIRSPSSGQRLVIQSELASDLRSFLDSRPPPSATTTRG